MSRLHNDEVYVVELLDQSWGGKHRWLPTLGVGLTKNDAKAEYQVWYQRDPDDKFRIRRYKRVVK